MFGRVMYSLLTGSSVCCLATAVAAQQAASTAPSAVEDRSTQEVPVVAGVSTGQATPDARGRQADDETTHDIVVTGSRVITNGNNSPAPITVITPETLQSTTPTNIPDALRKLPVFAASGSVAAVTNPGSNSVGNFLNLRALGANRTLILFNGHRVPPTNSDATVDTNVLPQLLLARVDVATGGSSAVYGSDAVTGVVNFIVDRKFQGVRAVAQGGVSGRGDAGSYRLGVAAGSNFAGDRGHAEVSVEMFHQAGLDNKFDRKAGRKIYAETGTGTAANPYHLIENARSAASSFGGLITTGVLAGQQFCSNGVLCPFVHGTASGTAGVESGGDGTYIANSSITASLSTKQIFGRLDFDVTDSIHAYAQSTLAFARNTNNFIPPLANQTFTIGAGNAFLPASAQAALATAGQTDFRFSRTVLTQPPISTVYNGRNIDLTVGLEGKLGGGFNWDLYYTHGESRAKVEARNNVNYGKIAAALDAVRGPGGQIVCRVSVTNPGVYPGCVPLNLFGPSSESAAAFDYISDDTQFTLSNKLDDVGGSITGSPFSTWAGEVRVAASGEFRHATLLNTTTADPRFGPDCTGLRYNCNTRPYTSNTIGPASASQDVGEGAIEGDVPLLSGVPFAQSLNVNGAYRFTHYSTSGDAHTWKLGAVWRPDDQLTFRVTRSRDIRAPTLIDLFGPRNVNSSGYIDLHTGVTRSVVLVTEANPDLVPEVGKTWTAGIVLKPGFLPRFSMSIDYFDINISDAIANVGVSTEVQAQCEQSNGTSPLCALFVRPLPFSDRTAANFPTLVRSVPLNVAETKTRGIDAEMNYSLPVNFGTPALSGTLSLRGLMTYQPVYRTTQVPGTAPTELAGVAGQQQSLATAKVRVTGLFSYDTDHWSLNVQERWRSSLKQSGISTLVFTNPKVPAAAFTDLTFTARTGKEFEFFFSVQNLLDKEPPVFIGTGFASAPNFFFPAVNGDDVIGRYFTAGARLRF
jgi:iron complex outermembrane receptor protein